MNDNVMEVEKHTVDQFLARSTSIPLLDIRSPAEYQHGHIPGAMSFPLFSDEERAIIGTLYKQESGTAALKKGLEIVGPKMVRFIESAEALGARDLGLYCWRGGMRSSSMGWLLQKAVFNIHLLDGGYKAYRSGLIDFFNQNLPLIILTGYTGSKKTAFLQMLEKQGEQIIDLEALAGHQGSSFGNRKTTGQPSSEHFQNLIYKDFRAFDLARQIWIEDECMRIGQVTLIEGLFRQMSKSPHVFLSIDKTERINFLVEEYGMLPIEKLIEATYSIQKKLGSEKTTKAVELMKEGNLEAAAEIILTYYDRFYHKSISKKEALVVRKIECQMNELPELAVGLANDIVNEI
ncbi:MAG: tRNA 2-selenouridine(34) synthase MnmH [Saprospiraceae bacterium]|nr:tRNA 2-selenouridine(34) synthase MnmH [Saprospiraceae bacterium]